MDREVTLPDMLDAREARVWRQNQLLNEYALPVVSFTMNIAGPVKNSTIIRRAFREGLNRLEDALRAGRMAIKAKETLDRHTGCEALLVVSGDEQALKALCVSLEDEDALGRLFDIDVLSPTGGKLDREALGCPPRPCLICGREGKFCSSRRLHTVEELQAKTQHILRAFFAQKDADTLASQAVRALLYEVCASPKPGLVDRLNAGSHSDMDIFTFMDSAAALTGYLRKAVLLGMDTADKPAEESFLLLRRLGLAAERDMLTATKGVNTHKGAIFSLGTVCCATGRLWTPERPWALAEDLLKEAGRLYEKEAVRDLAAIREHSADTAGGQLYLQYGFKGIRGELAQGLPSVGDIGLPALRRALEAGADLEQAGLAALVQLIKHVTDTNLLSRGGIEGQQWAAEQAGQLRCPMPTREELEKMDRDMIARRLSPGGCADLLAITYFLYFLSQL